MSGTTTWQEIVAAAAKLDIEPCAMSAVYSVESAGNGFLPSGRPKILFEGHVFWKELKKRGLDPQSLSAKNPDIVYPKWVTIGVVKRNMSSQLKAFCGFIRQNNMICHLKNKDGAGFALITPCRQKQAG